MKDAPRNDIELQFQSKSFNYYFLGALGALVVKIFFQTLDK
jgi:hypothetical protein